MSVPSCPRRRLLLPVMSGAVVLLVGIGIRDGLPHTNVFNVVWAGEVGDESLLELDDASIARILKGFRPEGEALVKLRRLLHDLDASEFLVRDHAMNKLLLYPVIPRTMLDELSTTGSTEVRLAVRRLRASQSPERIDLLLRSAYAAIERRTIRGKCGELLASLPFNVHKSTYRRGQTAIASTVEPSDSTTLRAALAARSPLIRRTAATILGDLSGVDAVDDLRPLLRDNDASVRLDVAIALGNLGRTESLLPLIDLLENEVFVIRWKASVALAGFVGESRGYNPAATRKAREASVRNWRTWLTQHASSVRLTTPIEVPAKVALFNGQDFTGWTPVGEEAADPNDVWEIRDGVLTAIPRKSGDLRTVAAFEDYRFNLSFRMPSVAGDSGVGVCLRDPSSNRPVYLEVQLHPGNCGDFYMINGFQAWAAGQPIGFRAVKWNESNERYQKWNQLEITVVSGSARVSVNGEVQNQADKLPAGASHVLLRNEGSMVEFRDVTLEPLE